MKTLKKITTMALLSCMVLGSTMNMACAVNSETNSKYEKSIVQSFDDNIEPFELVRTFRCNSADGATSEFNISGSTMIRFYAENNSNFTIKITLQKKGWFGIWNDVNINGEEYMKVLKNNHLELDTDKTSYSKGTYRFVATGSNGPDYNYSVKMREFNNT